MKKMMAALAVTATLFAAVPAQATGTVVWENRRARVTETITAREICDERDINGDGVLDCFTVHDATWRVTSKLARRVWVQVHCTFTEYASPYTGPLQQEVEIRPVVRKKGRTWTFQWERVEYTSDWACTAKRMRS